MSDNALSTEQVMQVFFFIVMKINIIIFFSSPFQISCIKKLN